MPSEYSCPVCDWPGVRAHTFDICPQCGVEFGYQDIKTPHAVLRARWIKAGQPYYRGLTPGEAERYMDTLVPPRPTLRGYFWNALLDLAARTNNDQLYVWAMRHR